MNQPKNFKAKSNPKHTLGIQKIQQFLKPIPSQGPQKIWTFEISNSYQRGPSLLQELSYGKVFAF